MESAAFGERGPKRGARKGAKAVIGEPLRTHIAGIPVVITRKRMKNVRLRVKPDGSVALSAPPTTSHREIEAFVASRADWIRATQANYRESLRARADSADAAEIAEWRAVVQACVPVLIERWEPVIGVKAGPLAYRNMTSRWGSCQPATGRICINVRLALYPPECLEYVVVHELCHLVERGHGPRFKALMDELMPDWRQRRDKLRR